jgi:DMSO/TMAO reductase YedYZ molybdopterin-dependent catalytic subunit
MNILTKIRRNARYERCWRFHCARHLKKGVRLKGILRQQHRMGQAKEMKRRLTMVRKALETARLRRPEAMRLRLEWLPGKQIAAGRLLDGSTWEETPA